MYTVELIRTHDRCPLCGSSHIVSGYGFAAGPLGGYQICSNCNQTIEFTPDIEGLDEEPAKQLISASDKLKLELEDKIAKQMTPRKITSNNELVIGLHYYIKPKGYDSEPKLEQVITEGFSNEEIKYLSANRIWCIDSNSQALDKFDIYGPVHIPTYDEVIKSIIGG